MSGQLESLTEYLLRSTPQRIHGAFKSETVDVQLVYSSKDLGAGRRRCGIARQTIELSWYAYPYREYPPVLLYTLVMAWIEGYANALHDELQLPAPTVDPSLDTEQQGRGDVTITLELAEELVIEEHPQGEIELHGKRWTLVSAEVWTAETFEVMASVKGGSDAED
ncbi:TPA: phage tail protein [Enterobacter roggenkampii]|uniref:phage tail protein n=1 Tax=Enterobacter roggenkampii TaxID=1812935 RepID=UPI001F2CDDB1|nr:phage tail protein [Enterobacter roggenkampii]MCE5963863.1 phage tail protein [Enterobacter roggenkampii]MCE5968296.1 phage tail protein [Enterobacter roggenkampii]MCU2348187.1 phage tail protein [Enterobacter roggenkampii]UHY24240.1 phage tail protein [Enterobacter roggenkampii]